MRIVIINADYPGFLAEHYAAQPHLRTAGYDEQMRARNDSLFGVADFYSRNMRALGHQAWELHITNGYMQRAWAREQGLRMRLPWPWPLTPRRRYLPLWAPWFISVLEAQLDHYRPDAILDHAFLTLPGRLLRRFRRRYGLVVVGQHAAAPVPEQADLSGYDAIVSSFPPTLDWARRRGVAAELNRLAFEPTVLDAVGSPDEAVGVSFVGSFHSVHRARTEWLEAVCREVDVHVWTPDAHALSPGSPIRRNLHGEAWGRRMYRVLKGSRITLNHHGSIPPFANNMRLYEATGMGTLLITDWKENLAEMFEPGREVVAYRSTDDCVEQIRHYLEHERERAAIAAAGQARTLREHTYLQRMRELIEIIERTRGASEGAR